MKTSIQRYVVLDTETGGLKASENSMLEIAMCGMDCELNDTGEYDSLIKPYGDYKITDGALRANGLTIEKINTGKESKQVLEEMIDFLNDQRVGKNKPVICAHNADFDIGFLVEFFAFHNKDIEKFVNPNHTFDTMWRSRERWTELTNYKLGTCCSAAGIELVNAHRALNDTRATKELVKYFLRNVRNDSTGEIKEKRYRETFEF